MSVLTPREFRLGDGETYEGYINPPLSPDNLYSIYLDVIEHDEALEDMREGRQLRGPPHYTYLLATVHTEPLITGEHGSWITAVSSAAGIMIVILVAAATAYYFYSRKNP